MSPRLLAYLLFREHVDRCPECEETRSELGGSLFFAPCYEANQLREEWHRLAAQEFNVVAHVCNAPDSPPVCPACEREKEKARAH